MAPLRRYLRITRHSALEVRIYLDNPGHAETWLLRRTDPALPRIIEAVRPLVLPKLWEEKERVKGKGKAKKGVKDVVTGDDFEVSIFLTDNSTPHSLLNKQKGFRDKPRLKSNSGKLTGWLSAGNTGDKPVDVDAGNTDAPITIREEEDEGDAPVALSHIAEAPAAEASKRGKRRRRQGSEEALFVDEPSGSDDEFELRSKVPAKRNKRRGQAANVAEAEVDTAREEQDDKKRLALDTWYDGFSIYGRILCLVVKRKGNGARIGAAASGSTGQGTASSQAMMENRVASSQAMMENWVSTQAAGKPDADDDGDD